MNTGLQWCRQQVSSSRDPVSPGGTSSAWRPAGTRRRRALLTAAFRFGTLGAGGALAGCRDSTGEDVNAARALNVQEQVATVLVSPHSDTIPVGATRDLTVRAVNSAGVAVTGRAPTWRSSDTTRAQVSSTGRVVALAPTDSVPVVITALIDGVEGQSAIVIYPDDRNCASATVRPTGARAGVGQFSRNGRDYYPADSTSDYRYVQGARGGFGSTLQLIGCGPGHSFAWYEWEYGGLVAAAFRAPFAGRTDRGLGIGDDLATFRTRYPEAIRVPGRFTMQPSVDFWTATYADAVFVVGFQDGRVAMMGVNWWDPYSLSPRPDPDNVFGPWVVGYGWEWSPGVPVFARVSPSAADLAVGQGIGLHGEVAAPVWESSDPGVATVDERGIVTGVAPGRATVRVRSSASPLHGASARITVADAEIASLTSGVPARSLTGAANSQRYFRIDVPSATARLVVTTSIVTSSGVLYASRERLPMITETLSDSTCSPMFWQFIFGSTRCSITQPRPGSWFILLRPFASYTGASVTATLYSGPEVSVTPDSIWLAPGLATRASARVFGSADTSVTWEVRNPSIARVDHTGLVTGVAGGRTVVVARSTVTPARLDTALVAVFGVKDLTSDTPVPGLAGPKGDLRFFRLVVPTGAARLDIATVGGTGYADLYAAPGRMPMPLFGGVQSPCEAFYASEGTVHSCTIERPAPGDWFVLVHGKEVYSDVTLVAGVRP